MQINTLGNQLSNWEISFFEEGLIKKDIAITVASVALGALVGAAIAAVASTPLGLTIGFGAGVGVLIAIVAVVFRRFNSLPEEVKVQSLNAVYSEPLPLDVIREIAKYADFDTLKIVSRVSKGVSKEISILNEDRRKIVRIAFGKEEWLKFYDLDVGIEPMLPRDIIEILNSPCHLDPTKIVRDTHIL